jgi:hypothetical protein
MEETKVDDKEQFEGGGYEEKKAKDSYFFKSGLLMQFSQFILCVTLQVGVTIFLMIDLAKKLPTENETPRIEVLLTRFACSFALHMFMQSEWESGMGNMKLVVSHPYRFTYPVEAFVIGLS